MSIQPLDSVNAFLEDLMARRGSITAAGNSNRMGIELAGGDIVEMTPFEPDPATFRHRYYYNTSSNILMRKIIVATTPVLVAYWKQVSN